VVLVAVQEDLVERARVGKERYGTLLMTHNGRDALVDAYQEALDLVMYLKQSIMERDDAKAEEATEDHGDV
jgi:hypothetical protein